MCDHLLEAVREAGQRVLAIYERDFDVDTKADDSPLTEADMAAHHALTDCLSRLTPVWPVLSEESGEIPYAERRQWTRYWLVDPLDGTKEFIKRNGEFTLNVALVEKGVPVFGIVHAPVLETTWWGQQGAGAWKQVGASDPESIRVRPLPDPAREAWQIVGSRSHGSAAFEAFCTRLPAHERVSMGSSIKLCRVAEGEADLYPRLAPTCEWDTAAAQAVVTAAGGLVLDVDTLEPLRCNQQESLLNPFFIVCGQRDARWEVALRECLAIGVGEDAASATYEMPREVRDHGSKADVTWNVTSVTPAMRAQLKGHAGKCIWFTGLSGSGKSTLANVLEVELNRRGYHTMLLDGDNIRHGLCKDLGMSEADRTENIRRVGEIAKLFADAGIVVITAFISPFRADRDAARQRFPAGDFVEVHVSTPLDVCEKRDPKGLYAKARQGRIKDFTGINSPYEPPEAAELVIDTTVYSPQDIIDQLLSAI
ncbi:3'(2'),5'-bisphosphate nucleotidase CysQ [Modicisalibacter sp. R2A 31.J]|uniref:3'(2'),5'-bisphosphate nucleotidase CysQ n=1 Tax=Modicisalibacter sp. R2A 31.J TaxID=2831898 RepID=UPI0031BB358F